MHKNSIFFRMLFLFYTEHYGIFLEIFYSFVITKTLNLSLHLFSTHNIWKKIYIEQDLST